MSEQKQNVDLQFGSSSLRGRPGGAVILAAAGCGDPELITVKALRRLQQADIVLTDRLVSENILKERCKEFEKVKGFKGIKNKIKFFFIKKINPGRSGNFNLFTFFVP